MSNRHFDELPLTARSRSEFDLESTYVDELSVAGAVNSLCHPIKCFPSKLHSVDGKLAARAPGSAAARTPPTRSCGVAWRGSAATFHGSHERQEADGRGIMRGLKKAALRIGTMTSSVDAHQPSERLSPECRGPRSCGSEGP